MRHIFLSLLAIMLAFVHLPTASADVLNIVTGNDYKPFTDENLPEGGLSSAIVKHVFAEAGIDIDISFMPWSRGYESAKNNIHFATFPYVKRPDREQHFLYSQPINTITQLVFVKRDRQIQMNKVDDLAGLSTCVPRGYALTKSVSTLLEKGVIKKLTAPDIDQCYLMLKFGRVDFLTFNQYVGWSAAYTAMGKEADNLLKTLDNPLATEGLHLIVSRSMKNGEMLLARFDKAIKTLRKQGVIQKIEKSYLSKTQQ